VRVTNFLEVGPLLSIRVKLWELFRGLLNPNFSSGWGVDNILCTYIAKNHGYTLDPSNQTDDLLWQVLGYDCGHMKVPKKKCDGKPVKHRICPHPTSFNPACLIVDASPLKHLDFHEGKKAGRYITKAFMKEKQWYRYMYPRYWLMIQGAISYCTSSLWLLLLNLYFDYDGLVPDAKHRVKTFSNTLNMIAIMLWLPRLLQAHLNIQ